MTISPDVTALLGTIPMLAGLSVRERRALAKSCRVRELEPYTRLLTQGEEGDCCYLLTEGRAEVVRNGRKLAELHPGDVCGELSLIDGGRRTADVTLLTHGEVLVVSRAAFAEIVPRSPEATQVILEQLCDRLRELDSRIVG